MKLASWQIRLRRRLARSGRVVEACGTWKVPNNPRSKEPDAGDIDELLFFAWRMLRPAGGAIEIQRADVRLAWTITPARSGGMVKNLVKSERGKR